MHCITPENLVHFINSVTKPSPSIHAKHLAVLSLTSACKEYPKRVTIAYKNNCSIMD